MELLESDQVQRARARRWQHDAADAQRSVHALRGSGVPGGLSGGRGDCAIRERDRGLPGSELDWLRILHDGVPVQYSKIQAGGATSFQIYFVQRSRVGGIRAGVHQGLPNRVPAFRDEVGNEGTGGDAGGAVAHAIWIPGCGSLRSGRGGWNACDLRAARREESRVVWRAAERSAHSVFSAFVERAAEVAGKSGDDRRRSGAGVALPAIWAEKGRADSAE